MANTFDISVVSETKLGYTFIVVQFSVNEFFAAED